MDTKLLYTPMAHAAETAIVGPVLESAFGSVKIIHCNEHF